MAVSRYVTHAFVLLVAVGLTGYASIDRQLPGNLRLGVVNAQGLVMGEGGQAGGVSLGRLSTIIRPVAVPTSTPVSHTPTLYTVGLGEDLGAVASRFGVSVSAIRWSNFGTLRAADAHVTVGDKVVIPPVDGLVVTVQPGDTGAGLAATYHVDAQAIADYNYIRDLDHLTPGASLVIPGGQGPEFDKPVPVAQPELAAAADPAVATLTPLRSAPVGSRSSAPGYTISTGGPAPGTNSTARFPYGYCTWYAASRHPVPFAGDAWQWFGNAQAAGMATGGTPRPGAIMVTWESGWGHVAIVESVNADGSWTVSEMNFAGFGVISSRTIRPGRVPLLGFIY